MSKLLKTVLLLTLTILSPACNDSHIHSYCPSIVHSPDVVKEWLKQANRCVKAPEAANYYFKAIADQQEAISQNCYVAR